MSVLDLSEIDPLKWAEVRHRVDVINCYLKIEKPKADDRRHHAAKLGLGVQRFGDLVKAWQAQQTAKSMLPGRDPVRPSKSKDGGIDPKARVIARQAIRQARTGTSLSVLVSTIEQRCSIMGLPSPSKSAVWLLTKEKFDSQMAFEKPSIIIGRAFLRLPTKDDVTVVMPEAILVAEHPSGRLIDMFISSKEPKDCACRIIEAIKQVPAGTAVTASAAEIALIAESISNDQLKEVTPYQAKLVLSDLLGKQIGRIRLNYQSMVLAPAQIMASERDRPLSRQDTELAVEFARQRHNEFLRTRFNDQQFGREAA